MVEILMIAGSNRRRYENARHARFHEEMYSMVSKVSAETIPVTAALLAEWKVSIDRENDTSRSLVYSYDSALLVEKDRERCNLLSYFFNTITNEQTSPLPAKKEAATRLKVVVQTYRKIQWEPVDVKSQLIDGMTLDLSTEVNAAAVATLGLEGILSSINRANTEYKNLQTHRSKEEQTNYAGQAKENRAASDHAFKAVCLLIEAGYLMAADEAAKQPVRDLILNMNRRIDYFKTSYNQSQGQKAANKKEDTEAPVADPAEEPVSEAADTPIVEAAADSAEVDVED